jgi:hypothetical protein
MTPTDARGVILLAALVLGGFYAWRWLTGRKVGQAKTKVSVGKLLGRGELVSPEGYLVAWGASFMILSIISVFAPALAGAFALLVALTATIENFDTISTSANELAKQKSKSGRE